MKIIFLDDERNIEDVTWKEYPSSYDLIVVRNYFQFIDVVDSLDTLEGVLFSFDHDLQDFHKEIEYTGLDCAKYLIEVMMENKNLRKEDLQYILHTKNPIGSLNIESYIETFKTHFSHDDDFSTCEGCGYTGPEVRSDGFGYNICYVNGCDSYSVRGLSRHDFY